MNATPLWLFKCKAVLVFFPPRTVTIGKTQTDYVFLQQKSNTTATAAVPAAGHWREINPPPTINEKQLESTHNTSFQRHYGEVPTFLQRKRDARIVYRCT